MKPCRGENPPLNSSSTSQICRGVRSHDDHSLECAFRSAARAGSAMRLINSPPCGAIRWLVGVKSVTLLKGSGVFSQQGATSYEPRAASSNPQPEAPSSSLEARSQCQLKMKASLPASN